MRTSTTVASLPTPHQLELKAEHDLTDQMFQDMLKMLTELTPAEHATLEDPDFITEDEADMIIIGRRDVEEDGEPSIPLDEVLREYGISPRKRSA